MEELEKWIADALNEDMGDVAGAMAEEIMSLRRKVDVYDRAVTKLTAVVEGLSKENRHQRYSIVQLSQVLTGAGVSRAVIDSLIAEPGPLDTD